MTYIRTQVSRPCSLCGGALHAARARGYLASSGPRLTDISLHCVLVYSTGTPRARLCFNSVASLHRCSIAATALCAVVYAPRVVGGGGAVERRYMARFSACNVSRFCTTLLTNGDVVVRGRGLAVLLWTFWCTVRDARRSGRVGKWWWGVTGWKGRGRARWLRTAGAQRAALT